MDKLSFTVPFKSGDVDYRLEISVRRLAHTIHVDDRCILQEALDGVDWKVPDTCGC